MQAQIYSASVQGEIGAGLVAQIGYVGSRGRNVFNRIFVNTIDPVTGLRPAGAFLTTQIDRKSSLGETEYDGVTFGLQRNMKNGLLVQTIVHARPFDRQQRRQRRGQRMAGRTVRRMRAGSVGLRRPSWVARSTWSTSCRSAPSGRARPRAWPARYSATGT